MSKREDSEIKKINFFLGMYELAEKIRPETEEERKVLKEVKNKIYGHAYREISVNNHKNPMDIFYLRRDTLDIRTKITLQNEIHGVSSIDYSFVDNEIVRNQLYIDNINMEKSSIDITIETNKKRFIKFCTSALFQLEGLLNYFF